MNQLKKITQTNLILLVSFFMVATGNITFFTKALRMYELSFYNIAGIFSSIFFLFGIISVLLIILCINRTTKPVLITTLLISSCVSYFTYTYDTLMSKDTIGNILNTDYDEAIELANSHLLLFFLFLGVIPSIFVYKSKIIYKGFIQEAFSKTKWISALSLMVGVIVLSFSNFYMVLFNIHHNVAYRANPVMWMRSTVSVSYKIFFKKPKKFSLKKMGRDASINSQSKKIVILVVGESLRADKLPFNGYHRNTMPLLSKESIINLPNVTSCATSTFISLPCMFSLYDREEYSHKEAKATENILDVLSNTGKIKILWADNNFGDTGLAARVDKQSFMSKETNMKCNPECRDEGMLFAVDQYIKQNQNQNILVILHQRGSHGPIYNYRYPASFKKYTPTCDTNLITNCSPEELHNSYDNTVLYTDDFLYQTINLLKKHDQPYETALLYMSDHGESLGESGAYLHGLPHLIAPKEQTHIAALMWLGKKFKKKIDMQKLSTHSKEAFSHDNLAHTLLGAFDVKTSIYNKDKDILYSSKKNTVS